ncbi:MAG: sulfide/dihydroorotate dehydrogenase-like FAD/NAD-binding protein [Promethearchaeota archaeon]|nr:MAG: sulfide/dihydroorotate dehydrogenase-like FAD/NAD-binding protein [Candidatus Lokiarchaeota archaeon]
MAKDKFILTINGRKEIFTPGETILDIAKRMNIYIPTLCHLEGLEGYGACRLCLCKVNDSGREMIVPSCTTPAKEGMEVISKDEELQSLRKGILKLILSEHPYSCLICENKDKCEEQRPSLQKAGRIFGCYSCPNKNDCEIREIVEYLEINDIQYDLDYKNYPLKREDPFIEKDYNLCILCGRCVRICNELRGIGAINFVNRGHDAKVSTTLDLPSIDTNCQFCGACVDACPTGALSSKNTKWNTEFTEITKSTCGFCSVGCGFDYYSTYGNLIDSIPNKESIVNKGQGCVYGRFCTSQFNNGDSRLKFPSCKVNDKHIPTNWSDIYEKIVLQLKKYNPQEIAVLISPNLTNESAYILKLFSEQILKTKNIFMPIEDNAVNIFYDLMEKHLHQKVNLNDFQNLTDSNIILLFNANIQLTHPVLLTKLKKGKKRGAKIISINLTKYKLPLETKRLLDYDLNLSSKEIVDFIIIFTNTYFEYFKNSEDLINKKKDFQSLINQIDFNSQNQQFTKICKEIIHSIDKEKDFKGTVVFGFLKALSSEFIREVMGLILNVIILSKKHFNILPLWRSGNTAGVYQVAFSQNNFKPTPEILKEIGNGKIKALYLTERLNKRSLLDTLELIILQDIYPSGDLSFADIVLPSCSFIEESGTILNSESRLRNVKKSAHQKGNSKEDWRIICELSSIMNESDSNKFDYSDSTEILKALKTQNPNFGNLEIKNSDSQNNFYKPKLLDEYPRPFYEVFTEKSFNFRGEPIYNQVKDLKSLIEYRTEKMNIAQESNIEEIPIKQEFKVLNNEEVALNMYKLVIEAPLIARKARPSSFIIIMQYETSERIPLTLSNWDNEKGTITVYYQESGFSTRELTEAIKGDYLFSVVGPLGNEIELENFGTVLLGGGCYGIGAIYPIAKKLKALGNKVIVILEARNERLLYLENEFESIADEVIYFTSDGSKGLKGKIEHGIKYALEKYDSFDRCHFIGCNVMMMNASEITQSNGEIPTFVNLNTIMIDGTGMCGGCRVNLREGDKKITKFACVDGPTFDGHTVDWAHLLTRGERFDLSEKQIFHTHKCKAIESERKGDNNE